MVLTHLLVKSRLPVETFQIPLRLCQLLLEDLPLLLGLLDLYRLCCNAFVRPCRKLTCRFACRLEGKGDVGSSLCNCSDLGAEASKQTVDAQQSHWASAAWASEPWREATSLRPRPSNYLQPSIGTSTVLHSLRSMARRLKTQDEKKPFQSVNNNWTIGETL